MDMEKRSEKGLLLISSSPTKEVFTAPSSSSFHHLSSRRRPFKLIFPLRPTLLSLVGAFALGTVIMLSSWLITPAVLAVLATANGNVPAPGPDGKYVLQSEGIRATFIEYGASISNLFIKDVNGVERDIVLGFDNASYYSVDRQHPHLGGVPGRYANRIKNR